MTVLLMHTWGVYHSLYHRHSYTLLVLLYSGTRVACLCVRVGRVLLV
jgi:hypothetical protein